MNTQNTPVHIRLWHKDFWMVSIANMLLSMAITMMIPTLPNWMMMADGLTSEETGFSMGIFALGLLLPGVFCSYLVQSYRRNQVCVWAIILLAAAIIPPVYLYHMPFWMVVAMRLVQGMAFGLAQMVLASTLIIDTCESTHRTEANYAATWFGRFSLSLGPLLGLLLIQFLGLKTMLFVASGCCVASALLVMLVHIPFRTPDDHINLFSFDRFLLLSGWPLLFNLLLITVSMGLLLSLNLGIEFYALMMVGFLLALLAQRFVFPDAELMSEVVSGVILLIAAQLLLMFAPTSLLTSPLMGLGLGLIGSRFLLFFIKLSRHCQRGTAQSTYLIGWESGLYLGIGMGYCLFEGNTHSLLSASLVLTIVGLMVYVAIIHQWFVRHKNR